MLLEMAMALGTAIVANKAKITITASNSTNVKPLFTFLTYDHCIMKPKKKKRRIVSKKNQYLLLSFLTHEYKHRHLIKYE